MKCMYCGADTDSRICEHCGSVVNPAEPDRKEEAAKRAAEAAAAARQRRNRLIAVFLVIAAIIAVVAVGFFNEEGDPELTYEQAVEKLDKLYDKIGVISIPPVMGELDLSEADVGDSLPDISKYPPQVENTTPLYIEIFSSTEKAGAGTDAWLTEMAEKFNAGGFEAGGQPVSVQLRGIDSGVAADYISSGKYLPDAYTPSNELWGKMLDAKGIKAALVEKRLTGNVTGVLFSREKNEELIRDYGAVDLQSVNKAVIGGKIAMGYTNPFASSSGLNYLVSTLYAFDPDNPLSDAAAGEFVKFQANVPFVAFTTLQMRESAKGGVLDGFIMEYQSYANMPDIKSNYVFTPFGVRHDSPVFAIGDLPAEKAEILDQFIAFCKSAENQKLASDYGFNGYDEYAFDADKISGDVVVDAQKLWKEKKNAGVDVAAVFVADVSGSMEGERLTKLKESLIKGSKYIGRDNYIGLVSFSDLVNIHLPIGRFDLNQRALFTGSVESLRAGGQTAMYSGIAAGMKMLMDEKAKNPGVKLMLFVLTDGETNKGYSLSDLENVIAALPIPVYTIGYNANIAELQNVSRINEAASINADSDDVVYILGNLFRAQM